MVEYAEYSLESNMRMRNNGSSEDGVKDGVSGSGNERSDGQGDEADGEEALKGPVVGAVRRGRLGDVGGVVDCGLAIPGQQPCSQSQIPFPPSIPLPLVPSPNPISASPPAGPCGYHRSLVLPAARPLARHCHRHIITGDITGSDPP